MCNLYSHVNGPKAIRDLADAMGGDWLDSAGNLTTARDLPRRRGAGRALPPRGG
jgi:hypothetical protein